MPGIRQAPVGAVPAPVQDSYAVAADDGTERTLGQLVAWMLPAAPVPRRVTLHGISPPLDTPLQWLCEHGASPDAMLHLVVHV